MIYLLQSKIESYQSEMLEHSSRSMQVTMNYLLGAALALVRTAVRIIFTATAGILLATACWFIITTGALVGILDATATRSLLAAAAWVGRTCKKLIFLLVYLKLSMYCYCNNKYVVGEDCRHDFLMPVRQLFWSVLLFMGRLIYFSRLGSKLLNSKITFDLEKQF